MRTPLILSIVLHIVVLSTVIFNFTSSTSLDANQKPVTVELVQSAELTQVTAGKKDAPAQEAAAAAPPEEKKAEPAPKAPEPKPVEKVAEKQAAPPPPEPKSEPPKPVEAKPEPEKKAEAKEETKREEAAKPAKDSPKPEKPKAAEAKPKKPEPKPEPKDKPEPKEEAKPERDKTPFRDRIGDLLKHPAEAEKKAQPAPPVQTKREFDPDRISALLNRDPKAGSPAAQEGPKEPWRKPSSLQDQAAGVDSPTLPQREALGQPDGQDARLTRNDIDALSGQIGRCWNIPVGGLGADNIVVKIHIQLNKDGTLMRQPEIVNQGSSPFFRAASDAALRAVLQCQPYSLPPEKYGQWSDLTLNFDPKKMYGG